MVKKLDAIKIYEIAESGNTVIHFSLAKEECFHDLRVFFLSFLFE